jgi:hypothetical protein
MKTKQLLLTILFLFTVTFNYAQVSFTNAGIAVQGIARDANNTAITNGEKLTLKFLFYYMEANVEKIAFQNSDPNITPDIFGVFSHVIEVDPDTNELFSNHNMWLRIQTQIGTVTTTISDEQLNHVPYAISANNGVPTGTIMPFVGRPADVPIGWQLCDGTPIPARATRLKELLSPETAVPDLQGMFLRGAGGTGNHVGPIVNAIQEDGIRKHKHPDNFSIPTSGAHKHTIGFNETLFEPDGSNRLNAYTYQGEDEYIETNVGTPDGEHGHTIDGEVGDTGITETRPVNYGVNYIIKL